MKLSCSAASNIIGSTAMRFTRRSFLSVLSAQITLTSLSDSADAQPPAFRASSPGPGTAGAIWLPLIQQELTQSDHPVDFKWVGGNPGQVQTQLLSGAVDVSAFGPIGLAQARAQGHDVVIFGPALNNHGRWIVRGDSPFRDPHDLIGKRIATQPETSETFKQALLAAAGVGIDLKKQTKLIFGPPVVNYALFERGDVDAIIELEPLATRLVASGARQIATVSEMWQQSGGGDLFLVGLAAKRSWLAANQERAAHLARLYLDLNRTLASQPKLFKTYHDALSIPASDTHAIELLQKRMPEIYATQWNAAIWQDIDRQIDGAVKYGIVAKRPNTPVYDTTFLKGAGR